ncbi:MAG: Spy/CpxP family protein refolding chaperone [Aquisalimonadaceae bacterium]
MKTAFALLALALLGTPALAQHHGGGGHQGHSPYAGSEQRAIKALSDQQIEDLRAGRGMSLALPAELNGYPGPLHVLDLAEQLELTQAQQQRTQALYQEMQREASTLGERVIESERALDALFADGKATSENVTETTAKAARIQGELRAVHLKYHLHMMALLTPEQIKRYGHMRGYHGS